MNKSPYLKDNRLADVAAAIQFMAMCEPSAQPCWLLAEGISGDKNKEAHWRAIFQDHGEFFRQSPEEEDYYSLVWRRALPRLYDRLQGKMITQAEFDALPKDQKELVTRPPIPDAQIRTLVDIAITLHASQQEQQRDWRWRVPIVTSFIGSAIGAILGVWGISKKP